MPRPATGPPIPIAPVSSCRRASTLEAKDSWLFGRSIRVLNFWRFESFIKGGWKFHTEASTLR